MKTNKCIISSQLKGRYFIKYRSKLICPYLTYGDDLASSPIEKEIICKQILIDFLQYEQNHNILTIDSKQEKDGNIKKDAKQVSVDSLSRNMILQFFSRSWKKVAEMCTCYICARESIPVRDAPLRRTAGSAIFKQKTDLKQTLF